MPQMTHEEMVEFLQRHPAFFVEHDELLADLIVPHEAGHAVSLVERQVKLLRERNIDVRHRLNQLMDTARENDRLFDKSRRLILGMLEAQSPDQVVATLEDSLRTDFQGNLFEGSQHLLAWADNLIEIKTICHCGRKATMVLRTDAEGNVLREGAQVEIGGNESYISVCRKHFKEGMASRQPGDLPL